MCDERLITPIKPKYGNIMIRMNTVKTSEYNNTVIVHGFCADFIFKEFNIQRTKSVTSLNFINKCWNII